MKVDQMANEHNISVLRNQLLRLAKKGRHVFLHGRDSIGRKNMIKGIVKDVFESNRYISCRSKDGEDVYNALTNMNEVGTLFNSNGSFFVDILYCDPKKKDDSEYYNKLAKLIKEGRREIDNYPSHYPDDVGVLYDVVLVKWLVVYSKEPDNFPSYFKRQFKMISLEKTIGETVVIDEARKLLTYKGYEAEIGFKQIQLLALLDRHKDEFVSKHMIDDELWNGCGAYERQIYDHMCKIVSAFVGLGFDKEIVKTKMIKTVKKRKPLVGGYIFNSDFISLDFR